MRKKIFNIAEYLKENGVSPSVQRIKIYESVLLEKLHPTANMIFNKLCGEIPTLSKMTVYNTLKIFAERNIVRIVNIEDNELRYDATIETHGHFKCKLCEKIYDFEFKPQEDAFDKLENFKIEDTQVNIKGICPECNIN